MLVNGGDDKQWRCNRINVVRLVVLIPPSFTFIIRMRRIAVTFFLFESRHLSSSRLNNPYIVFVRRMLPVAFTSAARLQSVKAIELNKDGAHTL